MVDALVKVRMTEGETDVAVKKIKPVIAQKQLKENIAYRKRADVIVHQESVQPVSKGAGLIIGTERYLVPISEID